MTKPKEKFPIKCKFCGKDFIPRDHRVIVCNEKECRDKYNKYRYSVRRKECVCIECGKTYYATDKQSKEKCPDCVRPKHYNFKKFEQKIVCRKCGKVLGTRIKNISKSPLYESKETTCEDCKRNTWLEFSHRMKLNNPSYFGVSLTDEEYTEKKRIEQEDKLYKDSHREERMAEFRTATSERMKANNPMRNSETVKKMKETIKARVASGELTYKRGSDRKNWKGGTSRSIKNYIRISLKPWRKKMLSDANYTCTRCGKIGGTLHIHHKESFSEIVENIAHELNIDIHNLQFRSDEYNILEERVVEYHNNNDIGIVLCTDCHDEVDIHFHKESLKKGEKK